jgi:hypothetical protein
MSCYRIRRGLSVDDEWAEGGRRTQSAGKQVNHTCRKKHLRYYFSGQEVFTVFSCIVKSQRLVKCFVKDKIIEDLLRCRGALHDNSWIIFFRLNSTQFNRKDRRRIVASWRPKINLNNILFAIHFLPHGKYVSITKTHHIMLLGERASAIHRENQQDATL